MADREPAMLGVEPGAPEASAHEAETARVDARIDAALDADSAPVRRLEPEVRAPSSERDSARRDDRGAREARDGRPPRDAAGRAAEPRRGDASTVYVVGFWRRLAAALIDFAVVIPVTAILVWIVSKVAGIHLPATRMYGPDFWVDLLIASDPALMTGIGLFLAIGAIYLYLFQVTMGRTLGMKVLKLKIIDVWGDPPSNARCAARTAAYFASAATLLLGFVWIGFDSEKRGLHDWIAGTYVIRG